MRHKFASSGSNPRAVVRQCSLGLSVAGLIVGLAGCAGHSRCASTKPQAVPADEDYLAEAEQPDISVNAVSLVKTFGPQASPESKIARPSPSSTANPSDPAQAGIVTVSHQPSETNTDTAEGTLTIEGRRFRMRLVEDSGDSQATSQSKVSNASGQQIAGEVVDPFLPTTFDAASNEPSGDFVPEPIDHSASSLPLNLPTALSMIGGQHPVVGFAQWRVQEAYARVAQAEALWLPTLRAGISFHRHDGNYQASNGDIVDVNRNSLQYGLGAGATGAGTTPNPGIVAQFHLADALFQPDVARKTAWARGHAANGTLNQQLRDVALAYQELLTATQDARIILESRRKALTVSRLTSDFAATGQGLQADADRLQTEIQLIDNRLAMAHERVEVASTRLSEQLSLKGYRRLQPLDPTVVPLQMVELNQDEGSLISTGLSTRPELKEAQALVAAACDQYQRQKYAPFVPSVLLGFSTGQSGGGLGGNIGSVDDRYDFDAMLTWEVRNMGFGERAARQETAARVQQAKYRKIRMMDQVAREISEAYVQVKHRSARIAITEAAIQSASDSYERNLSRIRDGQGLPLEVLQSVQALEAAQRVYLESVAAYNSAQLQLQWALGWPVAAPPEANQ